MASERAVFWSYYNPEAHSKKISECCVCKRGITLGYKMDVNYKVGKVHIKQWEVNYTCQVRHIPIRGVAVAGSVVCFGCLNSIRKAHDAIQD
jgi:hypothetical protein